MTKERLPVTIESALFTVLGAISLPRGAAVTGHKESYLGGLADPARRERLSIDAALKLDLEHHAVTGKGFPIFAAYQLLIETAGGERFADPIAIQRHSIAAMRETGQACAALAAAGLPSATRRDRLEAAREVEEAIGELRDALPLLTRDSPDTS